MTREHDGDITPGTNSYYGEIEQPATPVQQTKKWGSNGTRYDEECAQCGRTAEIDNDTELCQCCGS